MIGDIWCTCVVYWLLALIIVYPPDEAISAGLTIELIIKKWLGSERESFVLYHIRKTSALLFAHCLIIPGFIGTLTWMHPWFISYINSYYSICFPILLFSSFLPICISTIIILIWRSNNWRNHPFAKCLSVYKTEHKSINAISREINQEYVRVDKFSSDLNSISRIIATENWLIKVTPYKINVISLRDAILVILTSADVPVVRDSNSPIQFIAIHVKSLNKNIESFSFKLNSIMWKELEQKSVNPVVNTKNIVIHQSLADRFFPVFNETVKDNPKMHFQEEQDNCIGCMSTSANVVLRRRCKDGNAHSDCTPCLCRPMWCLPCLSKWFAARQDPKKPETWLSSKAPCPTCRSAFCMLDVHIIEMQT